MKNRCLGSPVPNGPFVRLAVPARFIWIVLLLLSSGTIARAQSQPQTPSQPQAQPQAEANKDSLADSARKAKAKKGKSEPRKVYTEDDLSGRREGVSVVGQGSSGSGASAGAQNSDAGSSEGAAATSGRNDEQYWREKARKLHEEMDAVDQEIATLKEDIRKNGSAEVVGTGMGGATYYHDRNDRLRKLEEKREKLEKEMDLLREEGRKAGAPAGWFRAASTAEGAAPATGKNDEQYWRGRARELRTQMDAVDGQITQIKGEIQKGHSPECSVQVVADPKPATISCGEYQLKELGKRKAALQEQMDALLEEGRKAGAPAGWFR